MDVGREKPSMHSGEQDGRDSLNKRTQATLDQLIEMNETEEDLQW